VAGTIRKYGNSLKIVFGNGSSALCYPVGNTYYIVGNNGYGLLSLTLTGKQAFLYFNNNTKTVGTQVSSNLWILGGGASTTPVGSGGTPTPGPWEWPMDTSKWNISSPYGPRTTPYNGFHYGIDITGNGVRGTPVWAIHDSICSANTSNAGAGNYIQLDHTGESTRSLYMHFDQPGLPAQGSTVLKGQVIGYVGSSGDSTGAHLHFETHDPVSSPQDPILFMRARGHEFGEVQPA
jgi:murein DD-endopeptidase MepM/ murein hydrolase activator NlpD